MSWRIEVGDCRDVLAAMAPESVRCCVTSPPYWGLRDYGTAKWDGGDPGCSHKAPATSGKQLTSAGTLTYYHAHQCPCGARRIDSQLGLEPTPEEYVAQMVAVFHEVRRVLTKDGTLWLNLGDSYAGGGGFCATAPSTATSKSGKYGTAGAAMKSVGNVPGLKPKDLVGIPWRVAFALQADGWYLRSDIIWAKPNPMPESVTDRPTKAHEYVFLLSKSQRYFYDADAIAEPLKSSSILRLSQPTFDQQAGGEKDYGNGTNGNRSARRALVNLKGRAMPPQVGDDPDRWAGMTTRNKRSVWQIATSPFPEAHFATYPPALVEPCIKAGSAHGDTVLDPFAGAGTTGLVALRLGRSFLGVELSPEYAEIARRRIVGDASLLNQETL